MSCRPVAASSETFFKLRETHQTMQSNQLWQKMLGVCTSLKFWKFSAGDQTLTKKKAIFRSILRLWKTFCKISWFFDWSEFLWTFIRKKPIDFLPDLVRIYRDFFLRILDDFLAFFSEKLEIFYLKTWKFEEKILQNLKNSCLKKI